MIILVMLAIELPTFVKRQVHRTPSKNHIASITQRVYAFNLKQCIFIYLFIYLFIYFIYLFYLFIYLFIYLLFIYSIRPT